MADIVGFAQFLLVSLWGCLRKRPMYSRDAILRNSGLTQRYSGCIKTYWRKSVHFLYLCFADERIKITCRRHKQISRHDLNAWHGSTATITLREVIYILLSIQIAMTYRLSHDMIMLLASLSHCERNHRDAHQANFNVNKEIIIMMTTESLIDRHLYYHIVFYCPIGEV